MIAEERYPRGEVVGISYLHDALPLSPHVNYCRSVDPLQVKACVADLHHLERGRDCFHTCFHYHPHPGRESPFG